LSREVNEAKKIKNYRSAWPGRSEQTIGFQMAMWKNVLLLDRVFTKIA
jgi:hypothetical protein